jgi:hypothetical protein
MTPGNFYGACYGFILSNNGDYFTGANGLGQPYQYGLFNSNGQSELQVTNSNFDLFRTLAGTAWSQSQYPASIETSQATFSRTLVRSSYTYAVSVTLHFNNLP